MLERRWRAGGMQGCACTRWPVWGGLPVQLVAALAVLFSLARMHSCWARAHSNAPTHRGKVSRPRAHAHSIARQHAHARIPSHTGTCTSTHTTIRHPARNRARMQSHSLVSVLAQTHACACGFVHTACVYVHVGEHVRDPLFCCSSSSPPLLLSSFPPLLLLLSSGEFRSGSVDSGICSCRWPGVDRVVLELGR